MGKVKDLISKNRLWPVIILLALTAQACGLTPPSIEQAKMARDPDGREPTAIFAEDDTFFCLVELTHARPETRVKAMWTAVEVAGTEPNLPLDETELAVGDGLIQFKLTNNQPWPPGRYKVDLYLDDKLDRTLEFQVGQPVVADAAPEEALPAAVPPESSLLPPAVTPTLTPSPGPVADPPTATPADPEPTQPLRPLRPYTHPSQAFTLPVPEGWQKINEDGTSAAFGDDRSGVGAIFTNAGVVYTGQQLQEFINSFTVSFLKTFAENYQVQRQEAGPDDAIYLAMSYETPDGPGSADFLFEQRETIIFILYFVTPDAATLRPTWDQIMAGYQVDPGAALAAAPASTVSPPATPPPPAADDGSAPLPGRSRLYVTNKYREELIFEIHNTASRVPVDGKVPLDLDAGKYAYTIRVPAGAVNGEIEMEPNQSWAILIDENGNVYYPQQTYP